MDPNNPTFRERQAFTDIMLDIETFGTGNDAAIVSIGAVAFNADGENGSLFTNSPDLLAEGGQGFRVNIDLDKSAAEFRGNIDPATVEWWLSQGQEARTMLVNGTRLPLGRALNDFADWIKRVSGRPKALRLWSNGPTFDEVIVRSAFRRYSLVLPLSFRGSRCCRTMMDLAEQHGWDRSELGALSEGVVKHDALGDAVRQARVVASQRHFLRLTANVAGTSSGPGEIT